MKIYIIIHYQHIKFLDLKDKKDDLLIFLNEKIKLKDDFYSNFQSKIFYFKQINFDSFLYSIKSKNIENIKEILGLNDSVLIKKNYQLFCSDLFNPMNIIIFGLIKKYSKNLEVNFIYDGLVNLVNSKPRFTDLLRDYIKFFIYKYSLRLEFPIKKNCITGLDNKNVVKQFIPNNIKLEKYEKIEYINYSFHIIDKKINDKLIVYVEQNIPYLHNNYDFWIDKKDKFLEKFGLNQKFLVLAHTQSNKSYDNLINRKYELAEDDIISLCPSMVISHNSSVLINLKASGFKGRLVSLFPYHFTLACGRSKSSAFNVKKIFELNKIEIYE